MNNFTAPLNESPSEKEGKFSTVHIVPTDRETLNESPSKKEGKYEEAHQNTRAKVALNESPSEKEGKSSSTTKEPCGTWNPQ